jgi:hypothetical protein
MGYILCFLGVLPGIFAFPSIIKYLFYGIFCAFLLSGFNFLCVRLENMAQELIVSSYETAQQINTGALVLGAGLALTSMILVPALAMRLGLSASLTGALRIALMKASSRATTPSK